MFTIRKSIGIFLLTAVILSGCNSVETGNHVEAEQVSELTKEQQELVDTYKLDLEKGNDEAILFGYYTTFIKNDDYNNTTDTLIEQYNIAVNKAFDKSNEEFFNYNNWLDYSAINDETLEKIISFRDKRLTDIKKSMQLAIKQGDYTEAIEAYSMSIKDESTEALRYYALSLENDSKGLPSGYVNVSPYYDGAMADEILAHASARNGSLEKWIDSHNHLSFISGRTKLETIEIKNPTIGMTIKEVLISSWGKPESINKTTTAFSVREQWVYPNYNYLYFHDGVLISFQESN